MGSSAQHMFEPLVPANKSVVVVGAGCAGLVMLKALVDLPDELRSNFEVVLYERHRDVGGVWLPGPQAETPLYPLLHTNTPVSAMTYPGFPSPSGTPLYPSHEYVEQYHQDYASYNNLVPYIMLNHTLLSASWIGTPDKGSWELTIEDHEGHERHRTFDHLVVANGHNHYPHIPTFPGQEEWLRNCDAGGGRREILPSIFYRGPERFVNQTVVVVGSGVSGRDAASQVVLYARKVYHSVRSIGDPASGPAELKPEIAYFTSDAIVFADGSRAYDIDSVILGTGYDLRIPFLEASGEAAVKPKSSERQLDLTTNLRYLFPLHKHIFSLSASYPTNALAFIGLPILVANCPSDSAQSIYAAQIIANSSLLGSREELLQQLDTVEGDLLSQGYDPYDVGHRMVDGSTFDYKDGLIDYLKDEGAIPDAGDGINFVECWRHKQGSTSIRRGTEVVRVFSPGEPALHATDASAEKA